MTRKDFILLARALDDARMDAIMGLDGPTDRGIDLAAFYIADALGRDNQRFDRERFLRAAGVTGEYPEQEVPGLARRQAD